MFDQVRIGREASAEKKIVFSTSTKRWRHEIVCLKILNCFHLGFRLVSDGCTLTLFMYRRPTLYPLEIAVDFLKSP
jgi:hypothetical protein